MKRTAKQIMAIVMVGLMVLTVNAAQRKLGDIPFNSYITAEDVTGAQLPVGFIFMSTSSTNPATLLGYGTWTAVGAGYVLVGYKSGDPDFGTAGATVGAKTVTSTGSVSAPVFTGSSASITGTSGTESSHTHSVTAAGTNGSSSVSGTSGTESAHTHSVTSNVAVTGVSFTIIGTKMTTSGSGTAAATSYNGTTISSGNTSVTQPNPTVTNNAVTSGAGSSHSHGAGSYSAAAQTFTGSSVTSGAGSSHSHGAGSYVVTATGTNSTPTYTGNATSVIQPSLVVYMWERTA